jgi:hypothetical protein
MYKTTRSRIAVSSLLMAKSGAPSRPAFQVTCKLGRGGKATMRNNRPEVPKQLSSTDGKSTRALSQTAEANNLGKIYLDCGPLDADDAEPWRPAIDTLKKIYRVEKAADLHPRLAFADKPWPSPSFGPVSVAVLELLRRARSVFTAKGFKVDADPVNPLGDGKSCVLICEPTGNLPKGTDPLDLARQCQWECVKGAAEPVRDGQTILVPLWDSGNASAPLLSPSERTVKHPPRRKRSAMQVNRDRVMFAAITNGLAGKHYCRFLDEKGIHPPANWISDTCPSLHHS